MRQITVETHGTSGVLAGQPTSSGVRIRASLSFQQGENEYVFSHGHYWKSWGRHRAASAEARQTGASTCAQSRESGEVGRPRRGVGGWRLEQCDSHRGGAQRVWGAVF